VRDAAVTVLHEEHHLTVPGIGTERPTVRECDDRARAPVLVVDFSAVFGGDRAHDIGPFLVLNFSRIASVRAVFDRRRLLTIIAIVFCGMGFPQPEY
jgi:hypothetical protein